ncbi:MAG: [FeFe] hydrogenase H-cluster maturation GTPase HydF [Ruminococcaceae bacterium]|nr:[FeFe] hydrogenase H-cluster maturation GTPase HydF [Oscillospiraceae bacterium]
MNLNSVPASNRIHIGIFGNRNSGKSSLINAITSQNIAIVSDVLGTTTDPVEKAMELLPLGPVVIIDTPGLDDTGELGKKRVEKALGVLDKTDIAILVIDANLEMTESDKAIKEKLTEREIPYIVVYNKCDIAKKNIEDAFYVSSKTGENIDKLKEKLASLKPETIEEKRLVGDLIEEGDIVVLVTPIDKSAPKGRLILPQQQTIRDILDSGACAVVTRENELSLILSSLSKKPKLCITDSQVFKVVSEILPHDIALTSFSILFARKKGNLAKLAQGAKTLETLSDGDKVLIAEGCTHHRQCEDIGTVKIPNMILKHTNKKIGFEFTSGGEFPKDVTKYKLIVHCGGCMLNDKAVKSRMEKAEKNNVPMTNYGTLIAYITGILDRSLEPFNL